MDNQKQIKPATILFSTNTQVATQLFNVYEIRGPHGRGYESYNLWYVCAVW
jgi:hypothetical protein